MSAKDLLKEPSDYANPDKLKQTLARYQSPQAIMRALTGYDGSERPEDRFFTAETWDVIRGIDYAPTAKEMPAVVVGSMQDIQTLATLLDLLGGMPSNFLKVFADNFEHWLDIHERCNDPSLSSSQRIQRAAKKHDVLPDRFDLTPA